MADHLYALPSGYRLEQYEFSNVLSLGAYGIKYQALDHETGNQVAIKEYLPDGIAVRRDTRHEVTARGRSPSLYRGTSVPEDSEPVVVADMSVVPRSSADKQAFDVGLGRFLDEARMQARLEHANLVQVHRALRANGTGYVVMDYVEGETLAQLLERRSTLAEEDLNAVVGPILGPLELLHQHGFLHQDIRPGNIVLRSDGTPVLLEIGGSRQVHGGARQTFGDRARAPNLTAPTAGFSALEQYSSRSRLGPWTDIYALGAVMYACISGRPPPDAPSRVIEDELVPAAEAARGSYDENTLKAIDQALAVAAGERPSSVAAWRANLAFGGDSRPVAPQESSRLAARGASTLLGKRPSDDTGRKARWHWIGPIAALVVVTVILTYTDVGVLRSPGDDRQAVAAPSPAAASAASVAMPLATLVVRTEPEGAEVAVGGEVLGTTPLEAADVESGIQEVVLDHPLYETVELEQDLPAGETTVVTQTLVPATGALALTTEPAGAWIEMDGERLEQTTPTTVQAPAGPLTLFVAAPGFQREQIDAVVRKGDTATLDVALRASITYGTLTLALTPQDATVVLPGIEPEYAPGLSLAEGAYRVLVTRPGFVAEERTVEVAGDSEYAVSLTPDPQPFTVAVAPAGALVRFPEIGETYSPAMRLLPGDYRVQALLVGYATFDETISHGYEPTARDVTLTPGVAEFADKLADGSDGPTMVLVAGGDFRMGCLADAGCRDSEEPVRDVTVATTFALAKREVTYADYDRFTDASGRPRADNPRGWERGSLPVVNVSWTDAAAYADWLTAQTGRRYRLPSEAEWEYAARAGAETAYSWGEAIGEAQANCNGCGSRWDNIRPAPVGSFDANAWGLHDMHGNVWEWVADCFNPDHADAPSDASPRSDGDCNRRMLRGGSWSNSPRLLRLPTREWDDTAVRAIETGFRVAASN